MYMAATGNMFGRKAQNTHSTSNETIRLNSVTEIYFITADPNAGNVNKHDFFIEQKYSGDCFLKAFIRY